MPLVIVLLYTFSQDQKTVSPRFKNLSHFVIRNTNFGLLTFLKFIRGQIPNSAFKNHRNAKKLAKIESDNTI